MDDDTNEAFLLLLLSDANLPTGSFVASSGLESYIKHGFFNIPSVAQAFSEQEHNPPRLTSGTISFLRDSVQSYSMSALPFIRAVHEVLDRERGVLDQAEAETRVVQSVDEIVRLDELYETMTLNHVARRASKAQGVALLSLYTKGFSRPAWIPIPEEPQAVSNDALVDRLKTLVRKGLAPGHLAICWAVLAASLGLTRERSQQLHVFLHARALLSASVRLNTIGPYAAQQLLLHVVKPLVADAVESCKDVKLTIDGNGEVDDESAEDGPACTWPLGEIISTRHDLQHSRIFNS